MTGNQTLEGNSCRPSPLQISKKNKSELVDSQKLPRSMHQAVPKQVSKEATEDRSPNSQQKGTANSLADIIDSSLSLGDLKQIPSSVSPTVSDSRGSLEGGAYQEKKVSDHGTVKYSLALAKVSDGTSSLVKTSGNAKTSDRADFAESRKSSMCRGSTSSDVSDDSTCSSLSSSINKPHKANDSRWEAIQVVRSKDGALGLSHFRLLKRLG